MKGQPERRRGLRRFFVFFSLVLLAFPGEAAQTLRVSIPSVVWMEGEACALSDIADLEGRRDLTERAGALLLSARNGVITREQVIDALKVSGLEDVRVELEMPPTVRVQIAAQEELPPDDDPGPETKPRETSLGKENLGKGNWRGGSNPCPPGRARWRFNTEGPFPADGWCLQRPSFRGPPPRP